jgi:hypothetical protein
LRLLAAYAGRSQPRFRRASRFDASHTLSLRDVSPRATAHIFARGFNIAEYITLVDRLPISHNITRISLCEYQ